MAGAFFARGLASVYRDFYSFPYLEFRLDPGIVASAVSVTLAAALAGTLLSVRRAAALSPAEGMRPEPPPVYRATLLERLGLRGRFSEPTRMIFRHIERRPLKALLTVIGMSLACSILMITNFQEDAIDYMVKIQYGLSQREDMTVLFTEPTPRRARYSLSSLEGVEHAEVYRLVPARLSFGHRSHRMGVRGVEDERSLQHILDADLREVPIPDAGLVLTGYLANDMLGVAPGDSVTVEVLEGARPVFQVPVAAVTSEYLGVHAYMRREALNALMREGPAISAAYLSVAEGRENEIFRELKDTPAGSRNGDSRNRNRAVSRDDGRNDPLLRVHYRPARRVHCIRGGLQFGPRRALGTGAGTRLLAGTRVHQGRDRLHTSRRNGPADSRGHPLGFVCGIGLSAFLAHAFRSDLYRVPLIIHPSTYALSAGIILLSFALTAVAIWRNLSRLDLIEVLKTRE